MNSRQAAELYARSGHTPPPEITTPSAEHIRNTRRKVLDGIEFRSTLEATAYQILKSWVAAGVITDLRLQPQFLLQAGFMHEGRKIQSMKYTADFQYELNGNQVVVETKGFKTEGYKMRRKLFLAKFPKLIFREWDNDTVKGYL
jgi:hypothetical protein